MKEPKTRTEKKAYYTGKTAYMLRSQYVEVEIVEYIPSFGRDRFVVRPKGEKKNLKAEKLLFTKPRNI